jgi:hypothetical protein
MRNPTVATGCKGRSQSLKISLTGQQRGGRKRNGIAPKASAIASRMVRVLGA